MNFGFSDEQKDVQNLAREILTDLVTPESLAAYDDYKNERFDQALWAKLAEAGLLGVAIDEQFGGMGFGFIELALFVEEVGRSLAPVPVVSHCVSAAMTIQKYGSETQKQSLLPGAAKGELLLTAALLEDGVQTPDMTAQTAGIKQADGSYKVSGVKVCVPFAASAERMVLPVTTDEGVVLLLLNPKAEGVSLSLTKVTTYEPQYLVELDEVQVGSEDVLSEDPFAASWLGERTAAALCAMQVGLTDKAMRMTASYTAEREQFGVLIATFQAVGHRAANCFIDVGCLQLTTYQAVALLALESEATNEVTIAKIWAGDVGHRVSYASQHLHGGMGIDRDYALWRYCLWMRQNEMTLGNSAQQLSVLGDRIAAGVALFS